MTGWSLDTPMVGVFGSWGMGQDLRWAGLIGQGRRSWLTRIMIRAAFKPA